VNLGVSCGNPLVTAKLAKGEVVVDLGSGGGFDVFLAASKVGPDGKAIGVDISKDMLELARKNAEKSGVSNVSFIEALITSIPLPSDSVDCVISNCVINLVPEADKPMVFKEIFRLLKPGGRASISDILAKTELPAEFKRSMALYVSCIAGASQVKDYERYLKEAGFKETLVVDKRNDLNLYKEGCLSDKFTQQKSSSSCCNGALPVAQEAISDAGCCSASCCRAPPASQHAGPDAGCCSTSCCKADPPTSQKAVAALADIDINEWVSSFQIYAVKPSD